MTSIKFGALKLFTLLVGSGLLFACSNDTTDNILDKHLKTGKSYYSIVYNDSFAKRFGLNTNEAIKLSDGMQAIAIEIRQTNFKNRCFLHLYVNNDIDIYKPVKGDYFSGKGLEEYFFGDRYNDLDQEWVSSQFDLNIMKILFRSLKNAKDGLIQTLAYDKVHRSFVPSLSIVTIKPLCSTFSRDKYPAQLWIQKDSVKNYLLGNDTYGDPKYKQNNIIFDIPEKLIDMAAPYTSIAIEEEGKELGL